MNILQHVLIIGIMGFGATSLGVLTTVIGTPIAILMDIGTLTSGILWITSNQFRKYFLTKLEKHELLKVLAETKLNIISSYISTALEDEIISDEEYSVILSEHEKFNAMKEEIKIKARKENKHKTSS